MRCLRIAAAALAVVGGVAAGLAGQALLSPAPAHADGYCNTTYMNNGRDSYTYCHGTDIYGNRIDTVTTCYGGTNTCTTRDM